MNLKTYVLKLDGKEVFKTKSYTNLYKYLAYKLSGGMSFGIDMPTLRALGYSVEVI